MTVWRALQVCIFALAFSFVAGIVFACVMLTRDRTPASEPKVTRE